MIIKEFKKGKIINLANGDELTVISKLGEGGQGIVYKVSYKQKEYALKWYFPSYLKHMNLRNLLNVKKFHKNLERNVILGSPSKEYLWPLAVTEMKEGSFGYLMELRPSNFVGFTRLLNAVVNFKNTSTVINAAINMVNAFQALHRKGYSYQDLNDGNFFMDIENGDVLIADNDNVAPYGDSFGVSGKSRYMAPEIVLGNDKPNIRTDAFSLSVVLFMFFFLSHPLEGEKVASCPCLTEENEKKFYGSEPVFVCDPNDSSNRPVRGIHNNIIYLWPLFPSYLQDAFTRAFCEGTMNVTARLTEAEWKKVLYRLKDDVFRCPKCGEENFASQAENGIIECVECKHQGNKPLTLSSKDYQIALYPGKEITEWHTENDGDYTNIYGIVIQNKTNPNLWGIRNTSNKLWIAHFPNGEDRTINSNDVVPVLRGVRLSFENKNALIG